MPLAPTTRLGPYEIVAALGAGGMGEVYRARDTRLGRDVAIKVLPEHLSAHPELRARFDREAKAISSLNHPHICTLFDVGREGQTDYLVMELVEGESLSARIARGSLPIADVVRIGAQIADALDRAHRSGVVHRDLKPGNVMLARAGAKLMDFGLARGTGAEGPLSMSGSGPALTQSPTVVTGPSGTGPLTAEGAIIGTFQYMAPEQLQGGEADVRSDLWALGCVLYEMATGRPAYHGANPASLISSIMKDEPRPIAELVALAPPGLDRVVRACLAKDPDERWQSAHDLKLALHGAEAAGESAAAKGMGPIDLSSVTYHQLTFRRGSIINARFAPDGRTVIYDAAWEGGARRIRMTRTDSPETAEPPLPSAVLMSVSSRSEMALSLDRRMLGSWWLGTGMLAQAPLFGGSPREVAPEIYEADWLPDGQSLAVIRRQGLDQVVEFPIGNPVYRSAGWLVGLRVSPDGRQVAFTDMSGLQNGAVLLVVDRSGQVRDLGPIGFWPGGIAWKPDGNEIYFVQTKSTEGARLDATDLDGRRRQVMRFLSSYVTLNDLSRDGDILLSRASVTYSIACSRPGQERDTPLGLFDFALGKDLSEDGRTLLYDEQGVALGDEIQTYVGATDGSAPVRLGPGFARDLSPDGRWVLNIHENQLRVLPRGAGKPRVLDLAPVQAMHMTSWHPDGERIVVLGAEPGRGVRLFIIPLAGGAPRAVTPEGVGFASGTITKPVSPEGARVFAMSNQNELCVYALADGAPLHSIPLEEGEEPIRWCAGGKAVFIWRRGDVPARVERIELETGARAPWREYAPADLTGAVCSRSVLLTPDGEICAHTFSHLGSDLFVARGLS